MSSGLDKQEVKHLQSPFPKLLTISKPDEPLSRNFDLNTQNGHLYAICGRPEVAVDVISSWNVKIIEDYMVAIFEFGSSGSL